MNRRKFLWGASALSVLASLPRRVLAAATGYPRLLEGPMIGATTPGSFTVWSRARGLTTVTTSIGWMSPPCLNALVELVTFIHLVLGVEIRPTMRLAAGDLAQQPVLLC